MTFVKLCRKLRRQLCVSKSNEMKHTISFLLVLLLANNSYAQHSDSSGYENTKIIALGYTLQGLSINALNSELDHTGYGSLENSVRCISVTFGSTTPLLPVQTYYGADFGLDTKPASAGKYKKFNYYRIHAGIEYPVVAQKGFQIKAHLAGSFSAMALRLYDTLPDTTSLTIYATGPADAKRLKANVLGIDVGFQQRMMVSNFMFLGTGFGYIIPVGAAKWKHDAGSFAEAPNAGLGSWYVQVKAGFEFHRHIIRKKDHAVNGFDLSDLSGI